MNPPRLSDLRNLGPKSENALANAGITTPEQLAALGSVNAYVALKRHDARVSLNMLWALEGALTDRDWREVARNDRLRLLLSHELSSVNGTA